MVRASLLAALLCIVLPSILRASDWKPADGPLRTRWAAELTPENAHREYPRPQLVRERWTCLNGLWQYAVRPRDEGRPASFDGEILVPFPIESALSGVMRTVGDENRLWYRRELARGDLRDGERLLLHFGAVDWEARVWVNGREMGEHRGGYDAFTFDITDALGPGGAQELVVAVWDPSDRGFQPRGKQVRDPQSIWYTSVTGIWQTVWIEPVPATRIDALEIVPDVDAQVARVMVRMSAAKDGDSVVVTATIDDRTHTVSGAANTTLELPIPAPRLWSPDSPQLYDLRVSLVAKREESRIADEVSSYFGMRKIAIGKGLDGANRLFLNGEPLFQFGPLDQGWWPDGLYTAPSDEALRYDIEVTRAMGFNMARKHVKVEPQRWYYWADRLGLLVWQDLPNGDRHIGPNDPDIERSPESAANFRRELQAMIDGRRHHPSIVVWVPFNEGWGQFETDAILAWTKQYDPTRLVDGPSGWSDRGTGDLHDIHSYPGPAMPGLESKRVAVLGEFGGLGLPLESHLWWNKRNWGYRTYSTREELLENYETLMRRLHPLIGSGLAAAIYTQTTDVEGEVNGLLTYDRAVVKLGVDRLAEIHRPLYGPPPLVKRRTLVATSEDVAQRWRYTTEKPAGDWTQPDFDDTAWSEGPAGFGEPTTPGSHIGTPWKTPDIWIRRRFELAAKDVAAKDLGGLHVRIHHDEDAEVFLNGLPAATLSGYVGEYVEEPARREAGETLQPGINTLAIHCHQTRGGQSIDAGLVVVTTTTVRTD